MLEEVRLADDSFLVLSDVDLRITWELRQLCSVETSGSEVEGPGSGDALSWLCSSSEQEEEAAGDGESLLAVSIIWPGI